MVFSPSSPWHLWHWPILISPFPALPLASIPAGFPILLLYYPLLLYGFPSRFLFFLPHQKSRHLMKFNHWLILCHFSSSTSVSFGHFLILVNGTIILSGTDYSKLSFALFKIHSPIVFWFPSGICVWHQHNTVPTEETLIFPGNRLIEHYFLHSRDQSLQHHCLNPSYSAPRLLQRYSRYTLPNGYNIPARLSFCCSSTGRYRIAWSPITSSSSQALRQVSRQGDSSLTPSGWLTQGSRHHLNCPGIWLPQRLPTYRGINTLWDKLGSIRDERE